MIDLSTTYLGLKLKNPLVASASPLSKNVEKVKRLEKEGIAAVVMYSLFEEQIIHESLELDHNLARGTETFAEALTYLPDVGTYSLLPDRYVANVEQLKKSVSIPVIGSLNGVSKGGWTRCPPHSGRRGGRARIESLLHPNQPRRPRADHRRCAS